MKVTRFLFFSPQHHYRCLSAGAVHGVWRDRRVLRIKSLYSRVVNNYSLSSFNYGSEDKND
jgi:hypothetical protein